MKQRIAISMLAAEVMGAKAALKWLESPQDVLDGKRPLDVWEDTEAAIIIERTLLRMQGLPKTR